jgi:hypothetical protein
MENNENLDIKLDVNFVKQEKLNVSVILPIKTATAKEFSELFKNCILSIKNQKVIPDELVIVHTNETILTEFLDSFDFSGMSINRLVWENEPNFSDQVNFGVKNSKNEWVSIVEFDDEYSSIWFKNVKEYMEHYQNIDGFMPIVVDIDDKGTFAGFTNEATFAANFSQEMGYLTNDTLHQYQNFQTSGMVFKKKIMDNFGGFKSNIKLTFIYEWFLRMTHNSVRFMTIPRIGYKHANLREGSIFWHYKFGTDRLSENDVKFWIQTAKQEYFFSEERVINHEELN